MTFAKGHLYESTGLYGHSTVRILDPDTANVLESIDMNGKLFGEGMQFVNDKMGGKLIQITWKSRKGFVYNATNLDLIREFTFTTTNNQGWGIALDDCRHELIVTDGT